MEYASQEIDMSILPGKVQEELIDFYQFLVEKYGKDKNDESIFKHSRLPEEFYKPIRVASYHHFNRNES